MTLSKPMIIFALRYCLQSTSYAPLACTRYLLDHWTEFDLGLQVQIIDEIQSRLATQTMPTDIALTWKDMLQPGYAEPAGVFVAYQPHYQPVFAIRGRPCLTKEMNRTLWNLTASRWSDFLSSYM